MRVKDFVEAAGLPVSIHAPRLRGAMLISRNFWRFQNNSLVLRERIVLGAAPILTHRLHRTKTIAIH
jgi:hypothetical protein